MGSQAKRDHDVLYGLTNNICLLSLYNNNPVACAASEGLCQTSKTRVRARLEIRTCRFTTYRHRFARAAPAQRIVDVHRPSMSARASRLSTYNSRCASHWFSFAWFLLAPGSSWSEKGEATREARGAQQV